MGNTCCQQSRFKRKRLALLLVGLDNAGKTVTAKGLAGVPFESPIPTVGFSIIELKTLDYDVKIFDLGGGPNIRGIWYKYFVDVHGVIFVVDSCDSDRFVEVREALEDILSSEKIMGKPLLILANKQDQECALDEIDIIECLKIEELVNRYKCPTLVESCCANEMNYNKSDPGIRNGFDWIINQIAKNYEQINLRVKMDIVEEEIKDKQEMLQKIARIKAEREALTKSEDPDAIETFSEYVSKMNGEANKESSKKADELNTADFYPERQDRDGNNSSDSSITFPEIYHINEYSADRERPRSAVHFVKHQLKLNDSIRRSQSAKTRRNKTAPAKTIIAKEFIPNRKVLDVSPGKSAPCIDTIFTVSKGQVSSSGDLYNGREYLEVQNKFDTKRLPPLKVRSKAQINRENDMNGIHVIDIE